MPQISANLRGSCHAWWHGSHRVVRHITVRALDLIYPPHCVLCGADLPDRLLAALICSPCQSTIESGWVSMCRTCAMPAPPRGSNFADEQDTEDLPDDCPRCRGQRRYFASVRALGVYRHALREVVLRMKQSRYESLTMAMGRLLAEKIACDSVTADVIVPVPMHWSRRFSRGINQAEILATSISKNLATPIRKNLLRCRRKTRKQGMLGPVERARNLRGAFCLAFGRNISGARILLVDDVMTTGATVGEASRVLHLAGAAGVHVAVVARGVGVD